MKSKKRKNNLLILLMLILFISVGYAMLTTTININGTGKVKNAKWDVHFANIQVTDGSVTPMTAANITDDTSAEFAVTLEKPGDFYEFTIDVVNAGTIDAMVGSFSKTPETVPDCVNYTVTWSNGETPKVKDGLAKGKTYQMKVRIEMLKDITADQLLTTEETLSLAVQLDCVQATDEAEYTVPTVPKPYYAFGNPTTASTQDYTTLRYPSDPKPHPTLPPTENPTLPLQQAKVFVKLDADGVQKSVCIIRNGNLECFRGGTTAYVAEEQEHLKEVFSDAICSDSSNVDCRASDFDCDVHSNGYVYCIDNATYYYCNVFSDGRVDCG